MPSFNPYPKNTGGTNGRQREAFQNVKSSRNLHQGRRPRLCYFVLRLPPPFHLKIERGETYKNSRNLQQERWPRLGDIIHWLLSLFYVR